MSAANIQHNEYITSGDQAYEQITRALVALLSGEPRPVSIEVPVDVWTQPVSQLIDALPEPLPTPVPDTATMAAVSELLKTCERPVIVVGGGAHEAAAEVQELAERLGAPVFTRRQGHGVLDARHRLWAPMPVGHTFWRDADVAIGIGTRMEFPITQWGTDDDLAIVQINLDADELDRHELGTLGLHGDAQATIRQLLDSLAGEELAAQDRTAEIASHRAAFESESAALAPQRAFLEAIRDAMPDDGVFVEDVTQLGFAAHVAFEFRQPRTFLTSGVAGTLGACVAQAVGAQSATDRPVLGIVGDGGFLFSSAELAQQRRAVHERCGPARRALAAGLVATQTLRPAALVDRSRRCALGGCAPHHR